MAFKPIKNERLSDKVVQVIMDQLKDGTLKPGDKLPNELELAEALGVSRGILREALTILQARKFIFRKPKDGTFVNPAVESLLDNKAEISLKQATYLDVLEMRECIEQRVVERIIDLATDAQILELYGFEEEASDSDGVHSIDYYFHYRMAELSQNAMFANFIDTFYDVIDELIEHTTQKRRNRREEIGMEHRQIVDALRDRDKKKARGAIVHHLEKVKANIQDMEEGN